MSVDTNSAKLCTVQTLLEAITVIVAMAMRNKRIHVLILMSVPCKASVPKQPIVKTVMEVSVVYAKLVTKATSVKLISTNVILLQLVVTGTQFA